MSTTSLWEDGQLPGLSGPKQAGTALRLIRAHLVPILIIWVILTLVAAGQTYALRTLHIFAAPGFSARFLGFTLLGGVVGSLISAATLRILLDRRPALSLDGGILAYVVISTLIAVVPALLNKLVTGTPPADTGDTQAMMAYGLRGLGVAFLMLVCALLWIKLILWPVGLAVGDPEVTPGVSWQLTHRAYWGYIIGAILLALIPYVIMTTIILMNRKAGVTSAAEAAASIPLIVAPFTALFGLAFTAMSAALFHLRRSGELDPAEAFD